LIFGQGRRFMAGMTKAYLLDTASGRRIGVRA